jgi:hypothetical protein
MLRQRCATGPADSRFPEKRFEPASAPALKQARRSVDEVTSVENNERNCAVPMAPAREFG